MRRLLSNYDSPSASFGRNSIDKVHRESIKTEGRDLREAATVQILLQDVLYAMLGGCTSFVRRAFLEPESDRYNVHLNGWIHGDVNTGSVLLLAQSETRRTDK